MILLRGMKHTIFCDHPLSSGKVVLALCPTLFEDENDALDKLSLYFSSFGEAVFISSSGGKVLFANDACRAFYKQDITGRYLLDIVGDQNASVLISAASANMPESVVCQAFGARSIISMLPMRALLVNIVSPAEDDVSEPVGGSVIQSFERNMRTPLSIIFSSVYALKKMLPAEDKTEEVLSIINHNAFSMLRFVENACDVMKYKSGTLSLAKKVSNLTEFLSEIIEKVRPFAEHFGISISADIPDSPILTSVDESKLRRAVLNVLSNAVKFSNAKDEIRVSMETLDSSAVIKITDSGVGISPAFLGDVFSAYSSVHWKDKIIDGIDAGSGFGLSVTEAIVKLHGGSVLVQSDRGSGTTVTIRIPINDEDDPVFHSPFPAYSDGIDPFLLEFSSILPREYYK